MHDVIVCSNLYVLSVPHPSCERHLCHRLVAWKLIGWFHVEAWLSPRPLVGFWSVAEALIWVREFHEIGRCGTSYYPGDNARWFGSDNSGRSWISLVLHLNIQEGPWKSWSFLALQGFWWHIANFCSCGKHCHFSLLRGWGRGSEWCAWFDDTVLSITNIWEGNALGAAVALWFWYRIHVTPNRSQPHLICLRTSDCNQKVEAAPISSGQSLDRNLYRDNNFECESVLLSYFSNMFLTPNFELFFLLKSIFGNDPPRWHPWFFWFQDPCSSACWEPHRKNRFFSMRFGQMVRPPLKPAILPQGTLHLQRGFWIYKCMVQPCNKV